MKTILFFFFLLAGLWAETFSVEIKRMNNRAVYDRISGCAIVINGYMPFWNGYIDAVLDYAKYGYNNKLYFKLDGIVYEISVKEIN